MKRCGWARSPAMIEYHDREWGVPVHDDRVLFEFLILEGAQAGLSWETILKKRENYRRVCRLRPRKVARFTAPDTAAAQDPGIVRNRLKIDSTVTNAAASSRSRSEFGSFDRFLWDFVAANRPKSRLRSSKQLPARTELSDKLSKELKQRGFRFVGTTICYAFMQAVGIANDHTVDCFRHGRR